MPMIGDDSTTTCPSARSDALAEVSSLGQHSEPASPSSPAGPSQPRALPSDDSFASNHARADVHTQDQAPPAMTASRLLARRLGASQTAGKPTAMPLSVRTRGSADVRSDLGLEANAAADSSAAAGFRTQIQVLREDEKIYDRFAWEYVLQEQGDGGKVVICNRKINGASPVLKSGDLVLKIKPKLTMADVDTVEFRRVMLRVLNMERHPGVLRLEEVLEDDKFFYMVMPHAKGGPLIYGLLEHFTDGVIPALVMKDLMRSVLMAVGHVHLQGMLHRDIKADNIVLEPSRHHGGGAGRPMIIDFDHADPDFYECGHILPKSRWVGTARFSAPETFLGVFSRQSDLYSVGVILYLLMTGKMPYNDEIFEEFVWSSPREEAELEDPSRSPHLQHRSRSPPWPVAPEGRVHAEVYAGMREAVVDWTCSPWPHQPECRALCQDLLQFAPKLRPVDADHALEHRWFQADVR